MGKRMMGTRMMGMGTRKSMISIMRKRKIDIRIKGIRIMMMGTVWMRIFWMKLSIFRILVSLKHVIKEAISLTWLRLACKTR